MNHTRQTLRAAQRAVVKAERSATRKQSSSKVQVLQVPTGVPGITITVMTTRAWRRAQQRSKAPAVSGYEIRHTHVLTGLVTERNLARIQKKAAL